MTYKDTVSMNKHPKNECCCTCNNSLISDVVKPKTSLNSDTSIDSYQHMSITTLLVYTLLGYKQPAWQMQHNRLPQHRKS